MWDEMQQGVAAQRADGERHQEAKEEFKEDFAHERDEDDAKQRQQADDGDGDEAAEPRCKHTHRSGGLMPLPPHISPTGEPNVYLVPSVLMMLITFSFKK